MLWLYLAMSLGLSVVVWISTNGLSKLGFIPYYCVLLLVGLAWPYALLVAINMVLEELLREDA